MSFEDYIKRVYVANPLMERSISITMIPAKLIQALERAYRAGFKDASGCSNPLDFGELFESFLRRPPHGG